MRKERNAFFESNVSPVENNMQLCDKKILTYRAKKVNIRFFAGRKRRMIKKIIYVVLGLLLLSVVSYALFTCSVVSEAVL